MNRVSPLVKSSINKLSDILCGRLGEQAVSSDQIQEDPETGSVLCEIKFETQKALLWFRQNGSASSINGVKVLLAGGSRPKNNPSLSDFTQVI
jgi:hypothetical protein